MLKKILIFLLLTATINATFPTQINVTKLYVATLDRAPDAKGLDYWVYKSDLNLELIAQSFFDQPELDIKYPKDTTNREFIKAIYNNLFKRVPDEKGWDYWEAELDEESIPRSLLILSVINGALGDDELILNNRITAGLSYANAKKDDIPLAINILKDITADKDSISSALCKFKIVDCGSDKKPIKKIEIVDDNEPVIVPVVPVVVPVLPVVDDTKDVNDTKVAFKQDVRFIDKTISSNILGYDYNNSIKQDDNLSVITLKSDFAKTLKVGEIISIPMGENKAFPIGKSGRVEAVDINGNSAKVTLSDITLLDVIDDLKVDEQSISLTADNLIDIIIPSYINSSQDVQTRQVRRRTGDKVFLNGGIVVTNGKRKRTRDKEQYLEKAELKLGLNIKISADERLKSGAIKKKEVAFIIDGKITDLKIALKPDIDLSRGSFGIKTIVTGDMDIDISTILKGEFLFGYFDEKWKEFEQSKTKALGIQLTGLTSDDKVGKIPIMGLMYSVTNLVTLNLKPKELLSVKNINALNDKLAIILWVYFDAKMGIVIEGKLGLKSKIKFQFGIDKKEGKKGEDVKHFLPIDKNTPVIETYVSGKIGVDGKLGFSTAVDVFIGGVRFINLGMFAGLQLKQEFELKSDDSEDAKASYYLQNFDDGTKWKWKIPNMVFCTKGNLDAGVLFNVDLGIGAKLKVWKFEVSGNLAFHDQYPRAKDIANLKVGERTGTWWKLSDWGECTNGCNLNKIINNNFNLKQ